MHSSVFESSKRLQVIAALVNRFELVIGTQGELLEHKTGIKM